MASITLKSKGECYVISFLEKLKDRNMDIDKAYDDMDCEFENAPYNLPNRFWNTIYKAEIQNENSHSIKIEGYYIPKSFIHSIV